MKILRPGRRDSRTERRETTFTGKVWLTPVMPATDGVVVNDVFFTVGSRTYWHSHERGQLLYVRSGQGLIGTRGERAQVISEGDVIWTGPGEHHWHGGGPGSCLLHTAVSLGTTNWGEPVSDAEYAAARSEGPRHGD